MFCFWICQPESVLNLFLIYKIFILIFTNFSLVALTKLALVTNRKNTVMRETSLNEKIIYWVTIWLLYFDIDVQKQPSRGILRKRCSQNMQQIYRRAPMPKCYFNKVALQLYWNHTSAWVFSCKFVA